MIPTLKKPKITKFLHLIGNKIDHLTNNMPLFIGSYAAISYMTTFSLIEGSLSLKLVLSLPVGGLGTIVALIASLPVLIGIDKIFKQNSGESALAASLNTNSYWMKKIKDLVQQVDHDCRIMPPEEKKVYANELRPNYLF